MKVFVVETDAPNPRKVLLVLLILVVVLASFLSGYALSLAVQRPSPASMTVIDDFGRAVSVSGPVERMVSLAASGTEIIFALGVEERLVAVDHISDYPPELAGMDLPRINTYPSVELETIVALNPDLVVAADIIAITDIERISAQGIPVIVLGPKTLDGILDNVMLMGLVTDTLPRAQEVVAGLRERIDAVLAKTSTVTERPLVYLEFFPLWTFGPGSFGHDLIVMAGGRNVGASLTVPFGEVSDEFVIASNPDIIVFTVGPFTTATKEEIENRTGWQQVNAVAEGRIFTVDDNEVARTAPRMVNALEDLAKILHPDLFP